MRFSHDRLYFIYQPGCDVCAKVKPVVRAFRDAHPEVPVVVVDITRNDWAADKWFPTVTPTLIKLRRDGTYDKYDGAPSANDPTGQQRTVKLEEVKAWLATNF